MLNYFENVNKIGDLFILTFFFFLRKKPSSESGMGLLGSISGKQALC